MHLHINPNWSYCEKCKMCLIEFWLQITFLVHICGYSTVLHFCYIFQLLGLILIFYSNLKLYSENNCVFVIFSCTYEHFYLCWLNTMQFITSITIISIVVNIYNILSLNNYNFYFFVNLKLSLNIYSLYFFFLFDFCINDISFENIYFP